MIVGTAVFCLPPKIAYGFHEACKGVALGDTHLGEILFGQSRQDLWRQACRECEAVQGLRGVQGLQGVQGLRGMQGLQGMQGW